MKRVIIKLCGFDSIAKVIGVVPEVFSLKPGEYSDFVPVGGATQLMRDNWMTLGRHLNNAITTVGKDVELQKKIKAKTTNHENATSN